MATRGRTDLGKFSMINTYIFSIDGALLDCNRSLYPGILHLLTFLKENKIKVFLYKPSSDCSQYKEYRILNSATLLAIFTRGEAKKENSLFFSSKVEEINFATSLGILVCKVLNKTNKEARGIKTFLSFSVASEVEKYVKMLLSDKEDAIKTYSMQNRVPIIQDESIEYITSFIKENKVKTILELGTAIGYSAIKMAEVANDLQITTIEIDKRKAEEARKNIKKAGLEGRVKVINADAMECNFRGKVDLIFLDAAKGKYIKLFNKYSSNLTFGGAIIADNLHFHGMVEDESLTHNRGTKKLIHKIRQFIEFLKTNKEYKTLFIDKGDGISISRKIGNID